MYKYITIFQVLNFLLLLLWIILQILILSVKKKKIVKKSMATILSSYKILPLRKQGNLMILETQNFLKYINVI